MQPGTIIRWIDFPDPQYGGEKKPRWFVCLGNTGALSDPFCIYLHSTSAQDYSDKKRSRFLMKKYSCFTSDCYLYYREKPYCYNESLLIKNPSVLTIGWIDKKDLATIYEGIRTSGSYSKIELFDIHSSLNISGITGIRMPRWFLAAGIGKYRTNMGAYLRGRLGEFPDTLKRAAGWSKGRAGWTDAENVPHE